jgi:hypothetical protein
VVLNTLKRYLKKQRKARKDSATCSALVAVELATASPSQGDQGTGSLAVVLSAGRRIEVGAGFDATTLARLVTVLERL